MAKKYLSSTGLTHLWEKIKSVFAPLVSPTFTGIPIAPTAATTTNSTQIATTQYVQNNMANCYTQTDADTALAKKVNIDGTTPMAYLDVGDRKAGSTVGKYSVVEGGDKAYVTDTSTGATSDMSNIASGYSSHAEGILTTASEMASHAEGGNTTASGQGSHAEGIKTTASRDGSHAEGILTTASEICSHAEGKNTTASGDSSHAEGENTTASGDSSHAEGILTTASEMASHAGGFHTIASGKKQTAIGTYNVEDSTGANLLIVGNGTSDTARSNAMVVTTGGDIIDGKGNKLSDKATIKTIAVTIPTSSWASNAATVVATGVTTDNSVIITPAPASYNEYANDMIYCSAQAENSLTFTCTTTPTVSITVNVLTVG